MQSYKIISLFSSLWLFSAVTGLVDSKTKGVENGVYFAKIKVFKNKSLGGKAPFRILGLNTINECLVECTGDLKCLSININTTRNHDGLYACALLDVQRFSGENGTTFTKLNGIDHYSIPVNISTFHMVFFYFHMFLWRKITQMHVINFFIKLTTRKGMLAVFFHFLFYGSQTVSLYSLLCTSLCSIPSFFAWITFYCMFL